MKSLIKYIPFLALIVSISACDQWQSHSTIPVFIEGASLRAIPTPWTSRPSFSQASPGTGITFNYSSYNSADLAKVDVYATYLPNTAVTGVPSSVASGSSYANSIAAVPTAGMLLPTGTNPKYLPNSGSTAVQIGYVAYDQLYKQQTNATPPVAFTSTPVITRVLLATYNAGEIVGDHTYTLTQLQAATAAVIPVISSVLPANQPAFLLTFTVTKKDGSVYNYLNSGVGLTANAAIGKVLAYNYTDTSTGSPVVRAYSIIVNGDEGSPFICGVSIRVAP